MAQLIALLLLATANGFVQRTAHRNNNIHITSLNVLSDRPDVVENKNTGLAEKKSFKVCLLFQHLLSATHLSIFVFVLALHANRVMAISRARSTLPYFMLTGACLS